MMGSAEKLVVSLLISCFVFIQNSGNVDALPNSCGANATKVDAVCCPVTDGLVCGGPDRGECTRINSNEELYSPASPELQQDDRLDWPHHFFDYACKCRNNWFGVFCNLCRYGYKGPNCDQRVVRVRKNAMSLTDAERAEFRRVISLSKTTMSPLTININVWDVDPVTAPIFVESTIHELFVYQHMTACRQTVITRNHGEPMHCAQPEHPYDYAHIGPGFLAWHRTMLLVWELFIQNMVPGAEDFMFPYWDWTGDGDQCEVCTNDLVGATNYSDPDGRLDKASPFYNWEMKCQFEEEMNGCRICDWNKPGKPLTRIPRGNPDVPTLPDQRQVDWVMSRPHFYTDPTDPKTAHLSFSAALEGLINEFGTTEDTMHGQGHLFFKGFMANVPNAPNDPIFMLHHANVDRLFEKWQRKHPVSPLDLPAMGAHPGHNRDASVVPFFPPLPLYGVMADSRSLGYTYDELVEEEASVQAASNQQSRQLRAEQHSQQTAPQGSGGSTAGGWATAAVAVLSVAVIALVVALVIVVRKNVKSMNGYRVIEETIPLLDE